MNPIKQFKYISFIRKTLVVMAVFGLNQFVFAVDGTLNGGGKSKKSNTTFSNIKKDLNLSLKSGYSFSSNKSFGFDKKGKVSMFNTVVSYKKGNVTYYLPYKNKPVLQKFKTPSAPVIR